MSFSRKIYFLLILFCLNILNFNYVFGADKSEDIQILRLRANLGADKEKFVGVGDTPIVTECDKAYFLEMLGWHKKATDELMLLDPKVNSDPEEKSRRNLCLLRVSVVYKIGEERKRREVYFENTVFSSGRGLSDITLQAFDVGQIMLRNNPFTITLKPGYQEGLPDIPDEAKKAFGGLPIPQNSLSLNLSRHFISLDNFYPPNSLDYAKHIVEYFQFSSIIEEKIREEVKRSFKSSLRPKLQLNPFLKEEPVIEQAMDSLETALLVLPFNPASNHRASCYFKKTADELFKQFKYNFHDSEQAIRLFINQKGDSALLGQALSSDDGKAPLDVKDIEQIYVNIASVRYMCYVCQGTYLYDINESRSIERSILSSILISQNAELGQIEQLLSSAPRVTVYVSGTKETLKK